MRGLRHFKRAASVAATVGVVVALSTQAMAQDGAVIRIGTGSTSGTYFPVGGLIANAISNPPGSLDCDLGGSCGVPGLMAGAVTTEGSVANVIGVEQRSTRHGAEPGGRGLFRLLRRGRVRRQGANRRPSSRGQPVHRIGPCGDPARQRHRNDRRSEGQAGVPGPQGIGNPGGGGDRSQGLRPSAQEP